MSDIKHKTFDLLVDMMLSAGGDGVSCLKCDKWKDISDEFELWASKNRLDFPFKRQNNDDCVIFSGTDIGTQECIIITSYDSAIIECFAEGIIKTLLF